MPGVDRQFVVVGSALRLIDFCNKCCGRNDVFRWIVDMWGRFRMSFRKPLNSVTRRCCSHCSSQLPPENAIPDEPSSALAVPAYATRGSVPLLAVVANPSAFSFAQRVIHNMEHRDRPWESSCLEVHRDNLVFYFETATPQGLAGFQHVARAVALGELPGEVVNMMTAGFATWKVPREEYHEMLQRRGGIEE
jgi:hypothetical protein